MVDSNLYIKIENGNQIIIIIYLDDIIFRGCKDELCKNFANKMKKEFETSMIGKL